VRVEILATLWILAVIGLGAVKFHYGLF